MHAGGDRRHSIAGFIMGFMAEISIIQAYLGLLLT